MKPDRMPPQTPSRRWRTTATTFAGVVIGSLLAAGCGFDGAYDLPLPGGPVDPENAIEITADFDDVLNLVPRSPVMVSDVAVGEVTDVTRVGWHAKITMQIQDDVELPDNAIADIQQTSLLGEKYVSLAPPAGERARGRLSSGDHLTLSATGRNPEVEEVLGALSLLLNGGGVGQLKSITHEVNLIMSGRQERIKHLFGELDTMVGALDDQKENIIAAIEAINDLTITLNRERDTVVEAIDTMGPAVTVLADQHDQLMRMLDSLDRLSVVGTRVINGTRENLLASLRHLRPVLTKLNEAGQSLPRALDLLVSFPFPKEATEIIKGDYANTSIIFDASLANLVGQIGEEEVGNLCDTLPPTGIPGLPEFQDLCEGLPDDLVEICTDPMDPQCLEELQELTKKQLKKVCDVLPDPKPNLCDGGVLNRPRGQLPGIPGGGLGSGNGNNGNGGGGGIGQGGGLLGGGLG